jgi:hypothetical protein
MMRPTGSEDPNQRSLSSCGMFDCMGWADGKTTGGPCYSMGTGCNNTVSAVYRALYTAAMGGAIARGALITVA